ncbi:MAG: S9 family peptidase [Acidimicrobiales bacterium]
MVRPLKPTDLYRLEYAADIALAPDEGSFVCTIAWPDDATDEIRSRLWRKALDDEAEPTLLLDGHRDTHPVFSPDGSQLAFLRADVASPAHAAVLDLGSSAVTVFDSIPDAAVDVQWLDDEHLVVVAPRRPPEQEGVDDDELARRPRVITALDYRFNARNWIHDRQRNIAIIDLATGGVGWLTSTSLDLRSLDCTGAAPAPDGTSILAILPDDDHEFSGATSVWLLSAAGGDAARLTEPGGSWSAVGWTRDGRPFATGHCEAAITSFDQPHLLDPAGVEGPERIGTDDVNCTALLGGSAGPVAIDGALLLPGIRGGTITIDRYDLATGTTTVVAPVRGMAGAFTASADGRLLLATVSTPTRPAEVWDCSVMVDGEPASVVLGLNHDLLAELDLVEPQVVTITSHGPGDDTTEVEAFLLHPPASAPSTGERRPGLLYVHGGPMSIYGLNFFDEFQLAAAAGYVVIGANPRGSDGYGIVFGRAVIGDMGGPDWLDVSAVADHLAALDTVDATRIGMGGGSYGGFMTSWAIGHTDRFAAALVERCVSNWETFAGTSDIGPWFGRRYGGATVESDVESLRRQSPITYAANNSTPTLILHSEQDWRCPPEQAEQLFAAYRRAGVDTTFVRFPGENHELSRSGKPRHRVERFVLIHDFFARHLGGGRFEL